MTIMSGQELVSAARAGSLDRVSYYLKKGVPPDVRDEDGYTALYWAACRGHSAICRILLLHDADVNSKSVKSAATPLMACADNNQVACMEGLLRQKSIRIDQRSARGDTALHMGAYRGYTKVVRLLIQYRINPFVQNNFERTALQEAQTQDEMECVEMLEGYMKLYKPNLPPRPRVQRQPTQSSWTAKEDIDPSLHEIHNDIIDLGDPCSHPSIPSIDSAVSLSPLNRMRRESPSKTSFSSFSNKTFDENSQFSLDCSSDYADGNKDGCQVNGHTSSKQINNTPIGHSLTSQLFCMNPVSTDSQYHSYSSTPSLKNSSLENGPTSTSSSAENKSTDSLPQVTSDEGNRKPLEKCEKYPSRVNDLSCKHSSDGLKCNNNLLPSSSRSLNISPDGKAHADLNVESSPDRSSETRAAYGNLEVVRGIRMSEFIENLQIKLLQYESALRKEQRMNCDLRLQIQSLKDENTKLKVTMNSLHTTLFERASSIKTKANGITPD